MGGMTEPELTSCCRCGPCCENGPGGLFGPEGKSGEIIVAPEELVICARCTSPGWGMGGFIGM
jgi:hypothetical protein